MSCVKCQQFAGTADKDNMCSQCYFEHNPEAKAAEKAKQEKIEKQRLCYGDYLDACSNGNEAAVRSYLDNNPLAKDVLTGLEYAVQNGQFSVVKLLVTTNTLSAAEETSAFRLLFAQGGGRGNVNDKKAIFDFFMARPGVVAELDNEVLKDIFVMGCFQDELRAYVLPPLLQCDSVEVTSSVVKAAKYANGIGTRQNVRTSEGDKVVALIEAAFKERNARLKQARDAERKQATTQQAAGNVEVDATEQTEQTEQTDSGRRTHARAAKKQKTRK